MAEQYSANQNNKIFYIVLGLYVIIGALLIPFYQHQINPDGISYISIAQKYLDGDFTNAINGHFSPLFCWLLVPFLGLGINPLLAAKLLNLCIGVSLFFIVRVWCVQIGILAIVQHTILAALIPITLYFAYHQITPDLLLTCVFLIYCLCSMKNDYARSQWKGLVAGALGGVAYLAKSYALPFFCIHFPLMHIFHYINNRSVSAHRRIIINFFLGCIIFFIISGFWIGLLSKKYGAFTTTTQTAHNFQCVMPGSPPKYGLIPPPNDTAISIWEDPYVRIEKIAWTPFKSLPDFIHWLKFIKKNILPTLKMFCLFSLVGFFLCIGYATFLIIQPKRLLNEHILVPAFFTIILYAGGYCGILIDERYIWCVLILMIIMAGKILSILYPLRVLSSVGKKLFLLIFFLSNSMLPIYKLYITKNTGKEIAMLSNELRKSIPLRSTIASNGDFYTSLFIAFHLNLKYFGTTEGYHHIMEIKSALEKDGIQYFIVWNGKDEIPLYLENFRQIYRKNYQNNLLLIFKKHNPSANSII